MTMSSYQPTTPAREGTPGYRFPSHLLHNIARLQQLYRELDHIVAQAQKGPRQPTP